ncbi:YbaB/EbfC family nucleoid-associated protein [bacterium]|jgi:DNA-binding protein YbaB|nr:YbaB/EbfC family nucleoid-associated protein [bacterium]MBT4649132.1 YbaB/EbfC family nucleoid-associated protein [bacterium]
MFNKLKQFNDLRKQANDLKSMMAKESVEVENKAVKIIMDGNQEIKTLDIKPEMLSANNKSDLEKGIKDAVAECIKKVQRKMAMKMQQSGDFNFPGMK